MLGANKNNASQVYSSRSTKSPDFVKKTNTIASLKILS